METTVGRVLVSAKIETLGDSVEAEAGLRSPDQVRWAEVREAMVDTGSKLLGLPRRLIEQRGLEPFAQTLSTTATGKVQCNRYRAVWLTINGRQCSIDVVEVSDDCPVLIGYVPLELLDFVVDPVNQRLVPNPEHGGRQVLDLF